MVKITDKKIDIKACLEACEANGLTPSEQPNKRAKSATFTTNDGQIKISNQLNVTLVKRPSEKRTEASKRRRIATRK